MDEVKRFELLKESIEFGVGGSPDGLESLDILAGIVKELDKLPFDVAGPGVQVLVHWEQGCSLDIHFRGFVALHEENKRTIAQLGLMQIFFKQDYPAGFITPIQGVRNWKQAAQVLADLLLRLRPDYRPWLERNYPELLGADNPTEPA